MLTIHISLRIIYEPRRCPSHPAGTPFLLPDTEHKSIIDELIVTAPFPTHPSIRQPRYKQKDRKKHSGIRCNDVEVFFPVPWHKLLRAGNSSSTLLLRWKRGWKIRKKNGLSALFPPLCLWPQRLLCSLAPLCGSFPPVQPGALPANAAQGLC